MDLIGRHFKQGDSSTDDMSSSSDYDTFDPDTPRTTLEKSTALSAKTGLDQERLSSSKAALSFKDNLLRKLNDEEELDLLLMEEEIEDKFVFLQHHDIKCLILGDAIKLHQSVITLFFRR